MLQSKLSFSLGDAVPPGFDYDSYMGAISSKMPKGDGQLSRPIVEHPGWVLALPAAIPRR